MALINALSDLEGDDEKPWCDLIFEVAGHERVSSADGEIAWVVGRAVADREGSRIPRTVDAFLDGRAPD